ncbi:hypothetical protein LshimejAT787_0104810 [Lyophyllum shimeji]|uniref:VWFA domain-containing protein n=1 Tax=Lyophyllum shimeji TaxID=47721 RepID=A0A9P3UI14_LYOSH|nr:hypothetical protein LshimejAT787_0104810 [Lyophyllum shimeji]
MTSPAPLINSLPTFCLIQLEGAQITPLHSQKQSRSCVAIGASKGRFRRATTRQKTDFLRLPVIIFLSDGECSVSDGTVRTTCRAAIAHGKSLSFQFVAFGPGTATLRRMAQIALEIQNTAPRAPLLPAAAALDSIFTEALDTVQLAETFFGCTSYGAEGYRGTQQ